LKTINQMLQNLYSAMETLTTIVSKIKEGNTHLQTRVQSVEQRVSDIKDAHLTTDSIISDLKKQVEQLKTCLDDQENRSRHNNLRFLRFPEDVEQESPSKFLQNILPELLKVPAEMREIEIERDNHSPGLKLAPGQRPRPFVVRFLRFLVKEWLLSLARNAGKVEWQGNHIQVFPDLSKDLQDRRHQFLQVKIKLHDQGIRYGLYYPVVLRVTIDQKQRSFTSPEAVEECLTE
uniref:L1 transposable element RRM domain-containing protein n=1 Tax=Latimeria chalumnae TaxID=7897 RepID=H3AFA4_LATCH